jgi:preprotein translocase subunit SecF
MEFFKIKKDIPFMRHALVFNTVSFLTFAAAVFFLFSRGLNLSVEFTGGAIVEARYEQPADLEGIRKAMNGLGIAEPHVQSFGTVRDVLVRLSVKDAAIAALRGTDGNGKSVLDPQKVLAAVLAPGGAGASIKRVEFVGPAVGEELANDGIKALLVVVVGIMLYLAFRFEWKYSVAAIVANLHDVVIILGFFAFFQWEFSLAVLAAVLAVLGYSVNESVVVFDRIRENFRRYRKMTPVEIIDSAITSTISRTIITHGSTQVMVGSMLLFGGPTLHYFALALTIGICFGIYSSVFVAAAVAMWLGIKREDLVKGDTKADSSPELKPSGKSSGMLAVKPSPKADPNDPNAGAVV